MSRRELIVGLAAAATLRAPFAAAATNGLMTAADVHIDHYPTVEAVRFLGSELAALMARQD